MDNSFLTSIPLSQSDQLLHSWGYDLVLEYFTIVHNVPSQFPFAVELATGTGRMSAVLSGVFPSVLTGDISLVDIAKAQQRVPPIFSDRVQFMQCNMESLPFNSHSIPVLFCMNTLHEVEHPLHCIDEMIRVIHPEGFLIVGDFNRLGFDTMQRIHNEVYHNNHNEGSISTNEIAHKLKTAFSSIKNIETELNMTFIAHGKRDN